MGKALQREIGAKVRARAARTGAGADLFIGCSICVHRSGINTVFCAFRESNSALCNTFHVWLTEFFAFRFIYFSFLEVCRHNYTTTTSFAKGIKIPTQVDIKTYLIFKCLLNASHHKPLHFSIASRIIWF